MLLVARDVVEADALIRARHKRIAVASAGIQSAQDSFRRNLERIRGGQWLPIEVLQAIQALDATQREWVNSIVDFNIAAARLGLADSSKQMTAMANVSSYADGVRRTRLYDSSKGRRNIRLGKVAIKRALEGSKSEDRREAMSESK